VCDILGSLVLLLALAPVILLVALAVKLTSKGPVLFVSKRVGVGNALFDMFKFRTMRIGAPQVATHLLQNPRAYLTPIGSFLRKSSLDELPQLFNVLKGDMSLVGPRPALFNQDDLIQLRTQKAVHLLRPGITGWAQINGRDELPIPIKVDYDEHYLKNQSFGLDFKILLLTVAKVFGASGVSH